MPELSFLTNHVLVLGLLAKQPRTTAREMATAIGITERAVRRIIADLDAIPDSNARGPSHVTKAHFVQSGSQ